MNKPTVATLWGGIGGGMLGFSAAGYEALWGADDRDFIAPDWFRESWRGWLNWYQPGMGVPPSWFSPTNLRHTIHPDVLIGSPPCKRFSLLAMRKKDRLDFDPEELEYTRFLHAVQDLRPKIFVLENLVSISNYLAVKNETGGGASLKAVENQRTIVWLPHYRVQSFVLNSVYYSTPQSRNRLYLVGVLQNLLPGDQDIPQVGYQPVTVPGLTIRDAFTGISRVPNMETANHSQRRIDGFRELEPGKSYYGSQNNRRLYWDKPGPTIASHRTQHVHPSEPRTLTVRECARIMGFPDSFVFHGPRTKQLDQVGCGVCPQVAKQIALELLPLLTQES